MFEEIIEISFLDPWTIEFLGFVFVLFFKVGRAF